MSAPARRLLLAPLLLPLVAVHCGEVDEEEVPELSIVVGAQQACSSQVRSVRLLRKTAGTTYKVLERQVKPPKGLPIATTTKLKGDEEQLLIAEYQVATADGGTEKVRQVVRLPSGTKGRIAMVLQCACRGVQCEGESFCAETPPGTGKTTCVEAELCGDGECRDGETSLSCPFDCAPECGNAVCDLDETCESCGEDCGSCDQGEGGAGGAAGAAGQGGAGGKPPCVPKTCAQISHESCGKTNDGCGAELDCGPCPQGQACGPAGLCTGALQCNVLTNQGCIPSRPRCMGAKGNLFCVVPQGGTDSAPCDITPTGDGCTSGFFCDNEDRCRELCYIDADCSPGFQCNLNLISSPPGAQGIKGCTKICNVLTQDCAASEACYPITNDAGDTKGACRPKGTLLEGSPCKNSDDCLPGTFCTSAGGPKVCFKICDPKDTVCKDGKSCIVVNQSYFGVCYNP